MDDSLSAEGRGLILKRQNRENARMTRKRRQIYDAFLTSLLNDLNTLLAFEIEVNEICNAPGTMNRNRDKINGCDLFRHGGFASKLEVKPENSLGSLGMIPPDILLSTALNFFKARVSINYKSEYWSTICVKDIYTSVTPCPMYVYLNGKGKIGSPYESRGVDEIIFDAGLRLNIMNKVMTSVYSCLYVNAYTYLILRFYRSLMDVLGVSLK